MVLSNSILSVHRVSKGVFYSIFEYSILSVHGGLLYSYSILSERINGGVPGGVPGMGISIYSKI